MHPTKKVRLPQRAQRSPRDRGSVHVDSVACSYLPFLCELCALCGNSWIIFSTANAGPVPRGGAAFTDRTEEWIEQRRSGRLQDEDLDLPRRTVSLEEIDEAVAAITGSMPGCSPRMAGASAVPSRSPWSWRRNWPT